LARILVNSNRSEALDLETNLKSMGHQILYTDFHGAKAVEIAEKLCVDLFLMHIPPENLDLQKGDNTKDNSPNWSYIFNSIVPVIPVIDINGKFNHYSVENILATSPHGYLFKQDTALPNIEKLKFTLDMVLCKQSRRDNEDSDLRKEGLFNDAEIFRTLYNKVPLPYQSLDENGFFLEVNQIWLNTMGYSREEVIGNWFGNFLAPDYGVNFKENFPQFLAAGEIHGVEFQMIKKDGTPIHVSYEGKIEYDNQGMFKKTHCIFKDITLSKKTEKALKESEEKFRTFIQQSLDGIVLLDEKGRIIEWNKGHEIITGIKKDEVIGKLFWDVKYTLTPLPRQTPQRLEHIKKLQLQALKTGEAPFLSQIYETELMRPDGEIRFVEQLAFPIKSSGGYRIGYVTRDVTQRKQMEEALDKRIVALSRPLDNQEEIRFQDLFNLKDIQEIQDLFAEANGVASIITRPDGTPITQPSNFCRLCTLIRNTREGEDNCYKSNSQWQNSEGQSIRKCLSGGLWEAGASIRIGGKHIANWLIGQVRDQDPNKGEIGAYAQKIGINPDEYVEAFYEVPYMSPDQFRKISRVLSAFANQLSSLAYQNVQQTRFITEREKAEKALQQSLREKEIMNQVVTQLVGASNTREIYHIIGETIKELLPDSYVIISGITADKKNIQIMEGFGFEEYLGEIEEIVGIHPFKIKLPVHNISDEMDDYFNDHLEESEGIYNLTFKRISPEECNRIERLMDVGKVYNMGFYWNGQNYGGLSMVLPQDQPMKHGRTIETIVSQASIALQHSFAEKAIKESLDEKEILLREIHHRVKNNMQIISSLLNLQSQHVEEAETLDILKESQGRVRSMAMIHEKLYQSPNFTKIDFKDYIEKLVSSLIYTYKLQRQDIKPVLEVKDVEMNIDTAIPCGLIINELVTNSLKYAFPTPESEGIIRIELNQIEDQFRLIISDNGVGLPPGILVEKSETLGLQLVNNLVKQLEGALQIDRVQGTKFTITFTELNYKERI
jgi:PAS domain S-box-containing protein